LNKRRKYGSDNRRVTVADEAARIIQEQGLNDFRSAKEKAAERLGMRSNVPLPSNGEIESALAERNRVFRGGQHFDHLRRLRQSAIRIMRSLEIFHPRLVGSVLSGNATEYSVVDLHLFSDSAEAIATKLDALNMTHRIVQFRHQFRRGHIEKFPGYRFEIDGFEFSVTVFPDLRRRRAPLSPVDRKPMRRAKLSEIELLLRTRPAEL